MRIFYCELSTRCWLNHSRISKLSKPLFGLLVLPGVRMIVRHIVAVGGGGGASELLLLLCRGYGGLGPVDRQALH